jgi:hypothetical protein
MHGQEALPPNRRPAVGRRMDQDLLDLIHGEPIVDRTPGVDTEFLMATQSRQDVKCDTESFAGHALAS